MDDSITAGTSPSISALALISVDLNKWRCGRSGEVQAAAWRVVLSLDSCSRYPERPLFVRMLADDVAQLEQAITHSSKAPSH
jgi:hypothetical protein